MNTFLWNLQPVLIFIVAMAGSIKLIQKKEAVLVPLAAFDLA
jgi:hypothetical protein